MLFASFTYMLIFLPLTVLATIAAQRWGGKLAAQITVLAASIVFYEQSGPINLAYVGGSILFNWGMGRWIDRSSGTVKKRALVIALTVNVTYLCVFKYLGFFASMIAFALPKGFQVPRLTSPMGVSFFTITQIMYLVDCYEGLVGASSLFDHATFVSFFPYILSGPLARAKRIKHQFGAFGGEDGKRSAMVARGLFHFSMGVFKKTIFADSYARVASYDHVSMGRPSAMEMWVFSLAYTLQIYFDFSGYSDMAIGSAMMLGIDIPRNFDRPLRALSVTEFWQRWHISLTEFITTYLYTPILRSFAKVTLTVSCFATFMSMGIAGLWHGPTWNYVVFGLIHGGGLAVNQVWRKKKMPRIPKPLSWLLVLVTVNSAFIVFGTPTLKVAGQQLLTLVNPSHAFVGGYLGRMNIQGLSLRIFGLPLALGLFVAFLGPSSEQMARDFRPTLRNCAASLVLLLVAFVFVNSNIPAPFVYFKF